MQSGFSLWSFRRAYLELYFDLCFDFLFFNKIYETSLLQEFCVFYSHLTLTPVLCIEWSHIQTHPVVFGYHLPTLHLRHQQEREIVKIPGFRWLANLLLPPFKNPLMNLLLHLQRLVIQCSINHHPLWHIETMHQGCIMTHRPVWKLCIRCHCFTNNPLHHLQLL